MPDAAALRQYAERHGLVYETGRPVTTETPIRSTSKSDHSLTGKLPGGFEGTIAINSYDSGDAPTVHRTLCLTEVPESIAFVPKLYCREASFKHTRSYTLDSEGFEADYRGTEFESEEVNRRWAVQVAADQDEGWLRELFAPSFLAWLGRHSPEDFTFELIEGRLVCRVPGVVDDEAGLDRLCELTAHIAERIRAESLEEERPRAPFSAPLPPPENTPEGEAADRAVAELDWDEPPESMMRAANAYRKVAARQPGALKPAILLGGGIGLLVLVFTVPSALFGDFGGGLSAVTGVVIAVALGGFLFVAVRRSQIQKRAARYGQRAFVQQYAATRGLEHEDPRAFHARFLRLDLPGPARNVIFGRHPLTDCETRLLLCSDPSGASAGFEVGVVQASGASASATPNTGNEEVAVAVDDGYVVASRPTAGGVGPSISGLDAVARAAAEAA